LKLQSGSDQELIVKERLKGLMPRTQVLLNKDGNALVRGSSGGDGVEVHELRSWGVPPCFSNCSYVDVVGAKKAVKVGNLVRQVQTPDVDGGEIDGCLKVLSECVNKGKRVGIELKGRLTVAAAVSGVTEFIVFLIVAAPFPLGA
jgi:hypothetical protein